MLPFPTSGQQTPLRSGLAQNPVSMPNPNVSYPRPAASPLPAQSGAIPQSSPLQRLNPFTSDYFHNLVQRAQSQAGTPRAFGTILGGIFNPFAQSILAGAYNRSQGISGPSPSGSANVAPYVRALYGYSPAPSAPSNVSRPIA